MIYDNLNISNNYSKLRYNKYGKSILFILNLKCNNYSKLRYNNLEWNI